MEQFKQKFIDEATELLEKLEHDLLVFEKNPKDIALLESILRTMHTIKGAGSMFGYEKIVEIAHRTENIYTKIKKNKIKISEKIINITFSVSDIIKSLLKDNSSKKIISNAQKLIEEIIVISGNNEIENQEQKFDFKLFYINFEPDADIENRGINLRKIFTQLNKIGNKIIIPKNINLEEKYPLGWEIFIATEKNIDVLEEIMLFVELECEITLISTKNLLLNKLFINNINENKNTNTVRTPEQIKQVVNQIFPKEKIKKNIEKKQEIFENAQEKNATIRVNANKLDDLINRLTELITLKSEIQLTAEQKGYKEIYELMEKLDNVTLNLKNDVFEIRLITIDTIRVNIERLIRDTSRQLKKEVQFTHQGLNTELDKTIVDRLLAPLLHIIRNSIDHGIETPQIRAERNKTAHGNIKLKAFQSGAFVYIQIIDDGAGIDKNKIIQKAILKNLINTNEKLTDKEIYALIFESGLTTADNLTKVSGRGVGMDVVKSEISKLRGTIEIESEFKIGTTITFKLPLSLSILNTLLVQSDNMFFLFPLEEIDRCEVINKNEMNVSESNFLKFENELIPFISLRKVFKQKNDFLKSQRAIIIKKQENSKAIIIDKIIGKLQAVVKPLGKAMENRKYLSGGSLLADGNIAYLIDSEKLVEYYEK